MEKIYGLYHEVMSGFRGGCSPLDSINDLITSVEQYRACGSLRGVVSLDVENAFESVSHNAILSALEHNGLEVESFVGFVAALQVDNYILLPQKATLRATRFFVSPILFYIALLGLAGELPGIIQA